MLSKFKLQTLKQNLWAIVAASFVARVVIFFALPATPSFLGPDEGTYALLTKWIGASKPASEFPLYGEGLYLSGRTLIVPANILYRAGINELDAVRLVASGYGFCALVLVVLITLKTYSQHVPRGHHQLCNENLIATLILVFSALPSHFLWSNLGLRESATEFWLMSSYFAFFAVFHYKRKITIIGLSTLVGSIVLTFSARPQVGWILGVSLVVFLMFRLRQRHSYFLLPAIICAVILGGTLNLGSTTESVFSPVSNIGETVSDKQDANQVNAVSAINTPSCPREMPETTLYPSSFDTYFCLAWRAPYMVSTFLFRPIISVDVTSTSSLMAASENILWLLFFLTIIVLSVRRSAVSFLEPILPSLIFFVLYVLGASAYQGNMGTGFRHKSLILWVVLLAIFALGWRESETPKQNSRNNSQESAV
jgi:hypothetical protein